MIPEGIVDSEWPRVERRVADMAVVFDRWQTNLGELILGLTEDGKYAATVGGVTLSIPRQVGKTFTIGVLIIALCIEFPGLVVLWTAHHGRTTTKTFRSIESLVRRKRIAPHLAPSRNDGIRTANGEQEISFANGSMILFGAREHGFGRGFDAVDVIVFDEAQKLGEKALDDMVPATNQARHEHGALLIYMGTPPREDDDGDAFTERRERALAGETANAIYVECSADEDADLFDRAQWEKANPSFPMHTPAESMLRMFENLPSDVSRRLEGLGIWPDKNAAKDAIPSWSKRVQLIEPEPAALGLAMDLDRVWLSLAASSAGDVPHLGSVLRVRVDAGKDDLLAVAGRIVTERRLHVVIDAKGPASSLEPDLRAVGISVAKRTLVRASFDDYVQACADTYDDFEAGRATHGDYDDLNDAVRAAGWRAGDRRVWSRKAGDVSMLEAATLAKWGATVGAPKPQLSYSY